MAKNIVECVPVLVLVLLLVNLNNVLSNTLITEHHHVHCTHQHPNEDQVSLDFFGIKPL